ncbi:MAG: aspartate carbamoyltransferase catalytic subunit [Pseudomonadota bacterium]|nr:aspartate carbamoyltransferase catalytic subunit [Pseudomonadota bacterium]
MTTSRPFKHLLDIASLPKPVVLGLLNTAQDILDNGAQSYSLKGKTVCNAFFETSTRTRGSFELAAKRLDAIVLNFDATNSATQKGESLIDTFRTLHAMNIDCFVIRHQQMWTAQTIAELLPEGCSVINAGDGHHAHPTQALLDMLTIQQHKKNFVDLSVAIVGDISHSRVARSEVAALEKLGVTDIRLVAPSHFLPDDLRSRSITHHLDLLEGIKDADVIITLRIQRERMHSADFPNVDDYHRLYGITTASLAVAKDDAIVMHPGPMNREIEIASAVADGNHSVILQQVNNGVAMRMAVIHTLLNS